MKKDNIDALFENLQDQFDVGVPEIGHQERFLNKLKSQDNAVVPNNSPRFKIWKPLLAVAAMVVICFSLMTIMNQQPQNNDLASVSPEYSKTQDFFTSTIANELNKLDNERTPETKALIDDALEQLNILETNYDLLKKDLSESGDDKRVIFAMISNFQNRIEVLQTVLQNIAHVKQLKNENYENQITI